MTAKLEPMSHRAVVSAWLRKLAESVGMPSPVSV